jgi:MSHA biogenesis protein MshM
VAPADQSDLQAGPEFLEKCIGAFTESRDTRFFHAAESAGTALEGLLGLFAGRDNGMGVVTAEPGCGKTMLRSELHRHLAGEGYVCAALENGWLDFDGVILELISQLRSRRVESASFPDRYSRLAELKQAILERVVRPGRKLAVLVDEAQQLEDSALEGLRALTNINAERQNYVVPVLFGQADLQDRIAARPAFVSRLLVDVRLQPMSRDATADYVRHRILIATGGAAPFTPAAIERLHAETRGVPRLVNQRCKLALQACLRSEKCVVYEEFIDTPPDETDVGESWPDSCLLSP